VAGVRTGLTVTMVAALAGGCAGGVDTATGEDALAGAARTVAVADLPGRATAARPMVARAPDGWVLPWQDGDGVHVRVVADAARAGERPDGDRFVGPGALLGVAGLSGGFAVALAVPDGARLFRFAGGEVRVQAVPAAALDGSAAPALASDGANLLLLTTRGGDIAVETPRPLSAGLVLIADDGSMRTVALGPVASLPSLSGDARGFIVAAGAAAWLVAGDGTVRAAPGSQIADARLFRRPLTAGAVVTADEIARDGARWLAVPGLVGWAAGDDDGDAATLELVDARGRWLARVGESLTWDGARPLPPTSAPDAAVCAADAARVIFAAPSGRDLVFAVLAAGAGNDLRSAAGVARLPNASARATAWRLGATSVLAAWNDPEGVVHYAVTEP
jgi:hypothetical protein